MVIDGNAFLTLSMDSHNTTILEKAAQRTVDGNYALWNALLNMNAIIITVFTAGILYLDDPVRLFVLPLILLALISAGLLIINCRSMRDTSKYQGILAMGKADKMTDADKDADLRRARAEHDWTVWREKAVEIITALQGISIVALVLFVVFSKTS